jgi:hypothetical protein
LRLELATKQVRTGMGFGPIDELNQWVPNPNAVSPLLRSKFDPGKLKGYVFILSRFRKPTDRHCKRDGAWQTNQP